MKFPQGITLTNLESMDPVKARKLIAQDCLLWLDQGNIQAQPGVYASVNTGNTPNAIPPLDWPSLFNWKDERDAREFLELAVPEGSTCAVCAIGITTLAAVCRFNSVTASALDGGTYMRSYLERYFDIDTLLRMERFFEGWGVSGKRAHERLPDPTDRLRFIFESIANHETGDPDFFALLGVDEPTHENE